MFKEEWGCEKRGNTDLAQIIDELRLSHIEIQPIFMFSLASNILSKGIYGKTTLCVPNPVSLKLLLFIINMFFVRSSCAPCWHTICQSYNFETHSSSCPPTPILSIRRPAF